MRKNIAEDRLRGPDDLGAAEPGDIGGVAPGVRRACHAAEPREGAGARPLPRPVLPHEQARLAPRPAQLGLGGDRAGSGLPTLVG